MFRDSQIRPIVLLLFALAGSNGCSDPGTSGDEHSDTDGVIGSGESGSEETSDTDRGDTGASSDSDDEVDPWCPEPDPNEPSPDELCEDIGTMCDAQRQCIPYLSSGLGYLGEGPGYCSPVSDEALALGESCDAELLTIFVGCDAPLFDHYYSDRCGEGAFCLVAGAEGVPEEWAPTAGVCRQFCDAEATEGCPAEHFCVARQEFGYCKPTCDPLADVNPACLERETCSETSEGSGVFVCLAPEDR